MPKRRTAFYTARLNRSLTQTELSRLSGVAQGVISDLERGKNTNPSWDVLSRLAQALGVKEEELIPRSKLPRKRPSPPRIVGAPLHHLMSVLSAQS